MTYDEEKGQIQRAVKMSLRLRLAQWRPVKMLASVTFKYWLFSGAYVLICLILYWLYGGFFTICLLCFATTGLLYRAEDYLLYHPELPAHSRVYVPAPSLFDLPYQSVCTRSGDGTMLHMFFIPQQPPEEAKSSPTLLYLHGNAGNIGHRIQNVAELYKYVKCNILMLEYRGYGFSQGSPSEEGLCMDARAGLEYLCNRSDINTNEIIVFGRSLGGAVAIDLATRGDSKHKIWCVILENTFTSIPDMAARIGGKFFDYLPLIFYKNKYMSLVKIQKMTVPTLFLAGLADTLVPPAMMKALYDNCKSSWKRIIPIAGGTHNETWHDSNYYQNILYFLTEVRAIPQPRSSSHSHWRIDDV